MSLDGRIEDFSLADVFQLITMGTRTGQLRVSSGKRVAYIDFANGQAVAAAMDKIIGESVVYEIFNWQNGEFTFEPTITPTNRNISLDTQNLILESVRQLDEWKKFAELIPDNDHIVAFASESRDRGENLTLQASEWKVLSMVDAKNSVADIARKIGFSEFETTDIIYRLVKQGLLRVLPPPPGTDRSEKKKTGLRDLLIASSNREDAVKPAVTPDAVQSKVAVLAIFVNSLLDNFDKPNGLYNAIKQDKSLRKRISDQTELYPEAAIIKIDDNDRIDVNDLDIKALSMDDTGRNNLIDILVTVKECIYYRAVEQSNKLAASRRHDKVMANVFTGNRALNRLNLSDIITPKQE